MDKCVYIYFLKGISSAKSDSAIRIDDQKLSSSNYIPYCNMNNAQLSFHGYQDAVKFFIAVPGQPTTSKILHNEQINVESQTSASSISPFGDILVISGGDGYIDFRVRNTTTITDTNEATIDGNRHMSYLIVWHMGST